MSADELTEPRTVTAPQEPLSTALRQATAAEHDRAESAPFVAALLGQDLPLTAFTDLIGQTFFVYAALERAAERWRPDPVAGPFVIDGLDRLPPLEADLSRMIGPDWRTRLTPLPATRAYCERIAGADSAARFVAHHYTRYLGDVSGGQVIASVMRRQHGAAASLGFYDFADLYAGPHHNPAAFRRHYRSLLDGTPWTSDQRAELITESEIAFRHNRAIFDALATGQAAAERLT